MDANTNASSLTQAMSTFLNVEVAGPGAAYH
jgi:hypothetical protein